KCTVAIRSLPSFPTRRSSDLYQDQDFVFTCDEGFPYSIRKFSQRLQRIIRYMDSMEKRITPHSFRHTHASLLIEANANMKVISQDRKSTRLNSSHVSISYAVF